jgi:hypothetical protein
MPQRKRKQRLMDEVADAMQELGAAGLDGVERLRRLYDPEVHFEDPIQAVDGVEPFLEAMRRVVRRAKRIGIEVTARIGNDREFVLLWRMSLTLKLGPTTTVDGASHVRAERGLVRYQRDYWDLGHMLASAIPGGQTVLRQVLRPLA